MRSPHSTIFLIMCIGGLTTRVVARGVNYYCNRGAVVGVAAVAVVAVVVVAVTVAVAVVAVTVTVAVARLLLLTKAIIYFML